MTRPKKYLYQIQYNDNTYRITEWTKQEFKTVAQVMAQGKAVCVLDEGVFKLTDIRAIVLIKQDEPNEKEKEAQKSPLEEWGFVDPETYLWLKEQGIINQEGGSE
jgi:hypothetical protein